MAMATSSSDSSQRPRTGWIPCGGPQIAVNAEALGVSNSMYTEQEQGIHEESVESRGQNVPSSEVNDDDTVIASIRAEDVALGLGRLPVGFYAVILHSGLEWRTEVKSSSINDDAVEWDGPIPIPSDLSAIVALEIYASFEFHPMLGKGEQLRKVTGTAEQLLCHSAQGLAFTFIQEDGDFVSPCSSLLVTIARKKRENGDSATSKVLSPHHETAEPECELEDMTDQGHRSLSRYQESGEKRDLERSIEQFERALEICPPDHPCRAAAQSNVAEAKMMHCLRDDGDISLDVPLALYRSALDTRLPGHLDRPLTLIQLAAVHFARFERQRDEVDAAHAEALLHEAKDLSSVESYVSQAADTMLQLYRRRTADLTQSVSDGQLSVEHTSAFGLTGTDPWTLSIQLLDRFGQTGNLVDLEQAISVLEAFLRSISALDDRYLTGLANLSVALSNRYRHLGNLDDLEGAIARLRDVVDLTPDDPDKPTFLSNLGSFFRERFERLGEQSDLDQAISLSRNAVDLTPDDDPGKCARLTSLGSSLKVRFGCFGDLGDLDQAISRQREAVDLAPDGHPDKPTCLNNLGNSFLNRFERLADLNDLEEGILRHRGAVDLTPVNHPDRPVRLNNLGTSFIYRFERLGQLGDLEQAISSQRQAVDLTPDGHLNKPAHLDSLGISLLIRFDLFKELDDLEYAILIQKDAVKITPDGSLSKPACLTNLGNSFLTRFEHLGEKTDIEQAISRFKDAVDITPDGHPDKPDRMNNLGNAYLACFEHLGNSDDLEQAISMQEKAVALTPEDHAKKRTFSNNLGNTLSTRFERLGDLSDLQKAISCYQNAADLTPDDHPDKPICLNNLSSSLHTRFDLLGELIDLEQAISRLEDAVDLTVELDGHPNKPAYLNNLNIFLAARFKRLGDLSDLEQAISKSLDAVNLTPHGHPNKPTCLSNLGSSLLLRFECLGEQHDLEQAILKLKGAVDHTDDGYVYKPDRLNVLGKSFLARFKLLGESQDFGQAILKQRDALSLIPEGHPDKPGLLNDLGDSFKARFERLGESSDLEQAISLYSCAACMFAGRIVDRFGASQRWISCARTLRHESLLRAYSTAVSLLPQLAWVGLSLAHRYHELMERAGVVREAAAAALDSGRPEAAVEWLEQGRSIVWGELFRLRSSYDELSSVYPDHARRLQQLSAALEHAGANREKTLSSLSEDAENAERPSFRQIESLQHVADRHRTLAIERDKLVQDIRRLPGFERFLLHKEFSQLRAAAHSGPVVILNAAETRCDALIITSSRADVIHVPLPNYSLERSKGLQNTLKSLLVRGSRYGQPAPLEGASPWTSILSPLWKCVVKPVLDALNISTPGDLSRIFWCPTGSFVFLPIHAAGFYNSRFSQPGHKVFDFVVSSYIPTLSILLSPPEHNVASTRGDLRLLAVRQPSSDGLVHLPGIDVEIEHIKAVIGDSPSGRPTLVESSLGTVEEVLTLMEDADWVHFACHGIQDSRHPTQSGLCLADGRRLRLPDIIALSRRRARGGLAFLSACQTATGDADLSDEAIHIAAGMLFAGYGSVVGTMWSISDNLAPLVTREVYERLFKLREDDATATGPDYREAARALQDAIASVRSGSNVSFSEWLPFIHVGL